MADLYSPEQQALENQFRATWRILAREGRVDGLDGMEYNRVIGQWRAAGRPTPLINFIIPAANQVPPPALPPGGLTFIPPQP